MYILYYTKTATIKKNKPVQYRIVRVSSFAPQKKIHVRIKNRRYIRLYAALGWHPSQASPFSLAWNIALVSDGMGKGMPKNKKITNIVQMLCVRALLLFERRFTQFIFFRRCVGVCECALKNVQKGFRLG